MKEAAENRQMFCLGRKDFSATYSQNKDILMCFWKWLCILGAHYLPNLSGFEWSLPSNGGGATLSVATKKIKDTFH